MLYHLLVPLSSRISILNVFQYLTFRSVGSALTALLVAFIVGPLLIRWLERRQIGQTIREDPPARHRVKAGTPTMGGALIILALVVSTLLWAEWTNPYIWIVLGVTLACGILGFIDDYQKAIRKNPDGIRPRTKLFWQFVIAFSAALFLYALPQFETEISVPLFKAFHPQIGWLYVPAAAVLVVGFSNAVNLTDGLDGLAIGPSLISAGVIGLFAYVSGHAVMANYLGIPYVPGAGTLSIFCTAMVGAGLGFLWFNTYPASVFMGDTGSLSLGGALGIMAVVIHQEVVLIIAGGIFMIEMFSVIVQVASYKWIGRRVFRMAPIHHHYELKGWEEPKIIVRFWIISVIMALIALSLLKLR